MRGIMGLMTPKKPSEAGDSYYFDGPVNNVKQGVPVPLLYGRLIVGGSPMNFAFLEGDMSIGSNTQYLITSSSEGTSAANSTTIGENADAITWSIF